MAWDPTTYARYAEERAQPAIDLIERLPARSYGTILDLGCGTGGWSRHLADAHPESRVLGVDASAAMLANAAQQPHPRVRYECHDLARWSPSNTYDLVFSNAALHWLPAPAETTRRIASWVAPYGVLAFQVPANHGEPSHRILREATQDVAWGDTFADVVRGEHVLPCATYREILEQSGFAVEAWDHVYRHRLQGADAVLEWLTGTTLRPYLAAMEAAGIQHVRLLDAVREPLRDAYPADGDETPFPFRRRFVIATRR